MADAPAPKRRKKSNPDTWKAAEREIAKRLGDGAERVPVTGRARGSAPDIKHPYYALEVKHGRQIPKLFTSAMDQAEKSVRGDQIPVVVFHPKGAPYDDCLVTIKLSDLERFRGYGRQDPQEDA